MRSPQEIAFRLRQEAANALLSMARPTWRGEVASPLPILPDPASVLDRLRGAPFAFQVTALADEILQHRFPLLGTMVETGPQIDWRRDYQHGKTSALAYLRLVPYLDFTRVGDHKNVWELSRHQYLIVLAQAWRLTGERAYLDRIAALLHDWQRANPFQRGINWTSALEVGFRALSWLWVYHLAATDLPPDTRELMIVGLHQHGLHLEYNLSYYFSPNTHLLGEALALQAIGTLLPKLPRADRWRMLGQQIVRRELERQVLADGSHFELSTYYHVYALDMFLFGYLLAGEPGDWRPVLEKMAAYLQALLGPAGRIPLMGDDDGGRFFHPYGDGACFGRATLATCGVLLNRPEWLRFPETLAEQAVWWTTKPAPAPTAASSPRQQVFPASGLAILRQGAREVLFDAGPIARGSGGHSHADALSFVLREGSTELLTDPGTYTYIADPAWRERFRGTAAHNTVRLNGVDQATPAGPFRWHDKPTVTLQEQRDGFLDAVCESRGLRHRRRLLFAQPDVIWVVDDIDGDPQDCLAEAFWHPGVPVRELGSNSFALGDLAQLSVAWATAELQPGWRSTTFGQKSEAPVIAASCKGALPLRLAARITFGPAEPFTLDQVPLGS